MLEADTGESSNAVQPDVEFSAPQHADATLARGASSHVATIKSLGLLHELTEYLSSVESLAATRKLQIQRLRDEKFNLQRKLKAVVAEGESRLRWADLSESIDASDLPPRLRAMVEDNKMLKEKVRKYREKLDAAQRATVAQSTQLQISREHVAKLEHQLKECAVAPQDVEMMRAQQQQLASAIHHAAELQRSVDILQHSMATQQRTAKQAQRVQQKEVDELTAVVTDQAATIAQQDKALRAAALEIKDLKSKLDPYRCKLAEVQQRGKNAQHVDDRGGCGAAHHNGQHSKQSTAAEHDAAVHVMLCFVHDADMLHMHGNTRHSEACALDECGASSSEHTHKPMDEYSAALVVQKNYRGYVTRKCVAEKRAREAAAATRIQARVRGIQARQKVARMHDEELKKRDAELEAAVTIQSATRGFFARKLVKHMKEEVTLKQNEAETKLVKRTSASTAKTAAEQRERRLRATSPNTRAAVKTPPRTYAHASTRPAN